MAAILSRNILIILLFHIVGGLVVFLLSPKGAGHKIKYLKKKVVEREEVPPIIEEEGHHTATSGLSVIQPKLPPQPDLVYKGSDLYQKPQNDWSKAKVITVPDDEVGGVSQTYSDEEEEQDYGVVPPDPRKFGLSPLYDAAEKRLNPILSQVGSKKSQQKRQKQIQQAGDMVAAQHQKVLTGLQKADDLVKAQHQEEEEEEEYKPLEAGRELEELMKEEDDEPEPTQ